MNRSNVGNVVTNGTQILSVGAVTATGITRQAHKNNQRELGKANKTLNNEPNSVDDLMGSSKIAQPKNSTIQNSDNSVQDVDQADFLYQDNSPQMQDISRNISNNIEWTDYLTDEEFDRVYDDMMKQDLDEDY